MFFPQTRQQLMARSVLGNDVVQETVDRVKLHSDYVPAYQGLVRMATNITRAFDTVDVS